MDFDEIKNCPKSGGDLCYKTEVTKDITNFFSLSCGFWTNSLMKEGSKFYTEQLQTLPELYKDLAWTDSKTDLIWLPNIINIQEKGMIFADGPDVTNWKWAGVLAKETDETEKEKLKGATHKPDMKTIKHFDERDFMDALSYIGLLPE